VRRLVYLDSARDDLQKIFAYITRESGHRTIGREFVRTLRQQCVKLAALPGSLGSLRAELRPDLRCFAFKGYVIFFRYECDALEVINIIEGHRDIEAAFSPEG
jgi:plasmid stabilization system protein ParE